jgi:hypothetical protein
VQHFTGSPVVNDGSHRDRDIDRLAFAAPAIAALAVTAALGFMFGIEAEVKKRIVVLAGDQRHIAAAAAVAAAGSAAGNEFLTPERKAAVTAVAGFNVDYNFVYKHVYSSRTTQRDARTIWQEKGMRRALCARTLTIIRRL